MTNLLTFAAGGRAKWFVLAAWIAIFVGSSAAGLPAKYTEAENNESTSFLPSESESTKALTKAEELQDGEQAPVVIVYRREGGLTAADQSQITADRDELNGRIQADRKTYRTVSPFGDPQPSPKGDAALLIANIEGDGESETIIDPVKDIRERVSDPGGGLEVKVGGAAGFAADLIVVFESINGTLILAAAAIVFLLLIGIYRSPIFWLIPIIAVAFAEIATRSVGYGLTEVGVTINGQSSSILSILVLGAGTDYALLLVSRYREELRRHEDKHEAMAIALRTAGPAIVASGLTVIAALLCLLLAKIDGTAGLGPIGAVGILVAMVAMLTLLPAILVVTGRWVFWRPSVFGWGNGIPHVGDSSADETHGAWRKVGDGVSKAPRRVWVGSVAILLVMASGLFFLDTGLTSADGFRDEVEAIEGQALLSKSFPGGANAPTDIIVPDPGKVQAVLTAVKGVPGVADAREALRGDGGVLLNATLEPDPYSAAAYDLIPGIRTAVKQAGGDEVLVGGASAIERDVRVAATRDTKVIPPVAIVVVLLILIGLLRSVTAPLLLMGTVILSFAASLGVGIVVFDVIFGFPGIDPSLPLFAFIFLVALGIDYNIFLMARVREETQKWGTRHGMVRGLAVTGAVITSAGLVLAGTFGALGVLPLVFLTEIGFVVAFGVLLDTFLVRSVLVPALVLDIGPKVWWPSSLQSAEEHEDAVTEPAVRGSRGTGRAPRA